MCHESGFHIIEWNNLWKPRRFYQRSFVPKCKTSCSPPPPDPVAPPPRRREEAGASSVGTRRCQAHLQNQPPFMVDHHCHRWKVTSTRRPTSTASATRYVATRCRSKQRRRTISEESGQTQTPVSWRTIKGGGFVTCVFLQKRQLHVESHSGSWRQSLSGCEGSHSSRSSRGRKIFNWGNWTCWRDLEGALTKNRPN